MRHFFLIYSSMFSSDEFVLKFFYLIFSYFFLDAKIHRWPFTTNLHIFPWSLATVRHFLLYTHIYALCWLEIAQTILVISFLWTRNNFFVFTIENCKNCTDNRKKVWWSESVRRRGVTSIMLRQTWEIPEVCLGLQMAVFTRVCKALCVEVIEGCRCGCAGCKDGKGCYSLWVW